MDGQKGFRWTVSESERSLGPKLDDLCTSQWTDLCGIWSALPKLGRQVGKIDQLVKHFPKQILVRHEKKVS